MSKIPDSNAYDVVIIGGGIMGASVAWFLTEQPDFDGRVLVIERDTTYETASTMHANSCMRQQFSTELNVKISQFAADFVKNLPAYMGNDPRVPDLTIQSFGYMYLADTSDFADHLRAVQKVQVGAGAATEILSPADIAGRYPFYNVDDIQLGSINLVDEGFWDSIAVFDWWRRSARERGVAFIENEVVAMTRTATGDRVQSVTLKTGEVVSCGAVVNATGPRAAQTAQMLDITLPVEPRKRYSWVFSAAKPLDRPLPLTIDPSGVHVRENGGGTYQAGGHTEIDPAVDPADFAMDYGLWEDHIWPTLAHRIPQFEALKLQTEWAGHYAMNTFDHNAIMGPHTDVENFYFLNGFSGHGLQQAPAMGRGTAELLVGGAYKSLDLSPFDFARIPQGRPIVETAVI